MSPERKPIDIPSLDDGFAPPIDEAGREALRNDPRVRYYRNPHPSSQMECESPIRAAYPFDVRELYVSDDDEVE